MNPKTKAALCGALALAVLLAPVVAPAPVWRVREPAVESMLATDRPILLVVFEEELPPPPPPRPEQNWTEGVRTPDGKTTFIYDPVNGTVSGPVHRSQDFRVALAFSGEIPADSEVSVMMSPPLEPRADGRDTVALLVLGTAGSPERGGRFWTEGGRSILHPEILDHLPEFTDDRDAYDRIAAVLDASLCLGVALDGDINEREAQRRDSLLARRGEDRTRIVPPRPECPPPSKDDLDKAEAVPVPSPAPTARR